MPDVSTSILLKLGGPLQLVVVLVFYPIDLKSDVEYDDVL